MTTHFLVAVDEASPTKVARTSKDAWLISLPLPGGLQASLPDLGSTFGFPVEFTCSCATMNTCACSHEVIYNFWRSLSDFLLSIADMSHSQSVVLDGIRKRLVKFYVDLPVWELSFADDKVSQTAQDYRESLIREASEFYRVHVHSGLPLRWAVWPQDSETLDDDVSSRMFTSDVGVLSEIRRLTERQSASPANDLAGDGIDHLYALIDSTWTSPVQILQAASVLDQINLIEISCHLLTYINKIVIGSGKSKIEREFLLRINGTLSDRNPNKWHFLPQEVVNDKGGSTSTKTSPSEGLDKFRSKLSKLLLYKQRARKSAYKAYSPVLDSGTDDEEPEADPVDTYLVAKRHERDEETAAPTLIDNRDAESNESESSQGDYELYAVYERPSQLPPPTRTTKSTTTLADWATAADQDLKQYITPNN